MRNAVILAAILTKVLLSRLRDGSTVETQIDPDMRDAAYQAIHKAMTEETQIIDSQRNALDLADDDTVRWMSCN